MVDRLVTAGLIDRQPHPESRRELVVELTARGREVVKAVTAHRRDEIAQVVRKMPPRANGTAWSALWPHSPTPVAKRPRSPTWMPRRSESDRVRRGLCVVVPAGIEPATFRV